MSCNGFWRKKSFVILKRPERILEWYFSKIFNIFECIIISLAKLLKEVKYIIHAEDIDNSDKVMTCTTTIASTSHTLKNLAVDKSFHSYYIQREFNDKRIW